jgi:hypothetical protein
MWLTATTDGQLSIEPSVQKPLPRVKNCDALLYGIFFDRVRSKGTPPWLYVNALSNTYTRPWWRNREWFGHCGQRRESKSDENRNS